MLGRPDPRLGHTWDVVGQTDPIAPIEVCHIPNRTQVDPNLADWDSRLNPARDRGGIAGWDVTSDDLHRGHQ